MNKVPNKELVDLFKIEEPKKNLVVLPESDSVSVIAELTNSDTKYVRDNFLQIIETGQTALSSLASLAKAAEDPEVYDSLTKMMKTMAEVNKDLLSIHKEAKSSSNTSHPQVVNNQLFVGTTSDLYSKLKGKLE
jgi:hypothetical protein